ncbi:YibE/F-like protein [Tepidibacter formicigenes DSM 15518]|jgi:uncharacterized membrane protein|uniref:YibE/F-like protein n=1 Tax=Tepidibacter formicigenes DSM 15518 TaxID=1123349 RepID=A0A1M6U8M1_9FIRM|nr:YibE/F-like protein [Tepidibacter formicigenes DSM 15518]
MKKSILIIITVLFTPLFNVYADEEPITYTEKAVILELLPLILKGFNPAIVTICVSICIATITLFIISGINSKSISAIIGTTGGVMTAGLLSYLIGSKVKLTGLNSDEAVMLSTMSDSINLDFKTLLFTGIIMEL